MPSLTYSNPAESKSNSHKPSPLRRFCRAVKHSATKLLIEGLISTQLVSGIGQPAYAMPNHSNAPVEISDRRNTAPSREVGWETWVSPDGVFYAMRLCYIHYIRRSGFSSKKLSRAWASGLIDFYRAHPLPIMFGLDVTGPSSASPASSSSDPSSDNILFGPDYIDAGASHKSNLSPLLVIALLEDSHSSSLSAAQLQKIVALADGHALPILLVHFAKQHSEYHGSGNHETSESSHETHAAKIQLLAHLANGQADEWFHLRLGAHRHSDDVDHEAEEHALHEAMAELAGEISAESHLHLQKLHRDFAAWFIEWHGHSGEHETAMGEEIDGQDHEHHEDTGSLGHHVAENYWAFEHGRHLAREDGHEHAHTHHLSAHTGSHSGEGYSELHAAQDHAIAFEVKEIDGRYGWRHGDIGQADGWWMYRGGKHGHAIVAHHSIEDHRETISFSAPTDWYKIVLGTSAYTPSVNRIAPTMAGHELPPTE